MLVRNPPSFSPLASSAFPLKPKFSAESLTKTRSSPMMGTSSVDHHHSLRRKRNAKNLALHLETPTLTLLRQEMPTHNSAPVTPISADTGKIGYTESTYKDEPVQILDGLFLGDEHNAANVAVLDRLGITFILNVAREVENPFRARAASVASGLSAKVTALQQQQQHQAKRPLRAASFDSTAELNTAPHITYQKFPWTHDQDDLSDYFERAFTYIDQARASGASVLVHCQLGVSRSASLVIAYVMRTLRLRFQEAYQHVQGKSPNVCPNLSLTYQLLDLEKTLHLESATAASTYRPLSPSLSTDSASDSCLSDSTAASSSASSPVTAVPSDNF